MCGRYTLQDVAAAKRAYEAAGSIIEQVGRRFNVSPSQSLPVITAQGASLMRWGLIPFWETSEKPKIAPINARSEEVLAKPTFRQAIQKRRCLVLADGFFEWRRINEKTKFPFFFHMRDSRPFTFAGIYEEATELRPATFAMLTTRPNEVMEPVHNRMPVILSPEGESRWLAEGPIDEKTVELLSTPYPAGEMEAIAVSSLVNSPRNDGPECLLPANDNQLGFNL